MNTIEDEKDNESTEGEFGSRDEPLGSVRVPGWDLDNSIEENEGDPDPEEIPGDIDAVEYEDSKAADEEKAGEDEMDRKSDDLDDLD